MHTEKTVEKFKKCSLAIIGNMLSQGLLNFVIFQVLFSGTLSIFRKIV